MTHVTSKLCYSVFVLIFLANSTSRADDITFSDVGGSGEGNSGNTATSSLIRSNQHDYSPSMLWDADAKKYRVWWCGSQYVSPQNPGNEGIWYSESSSTNLNSGWSTPVEAIDPEENGLDGGFDDGFMCDPSVIRYNGYYYLYYTGIGGSLDTSQIGVLKSVSGAKGTWSYPAGDTAIVQPFDTSKTTAQGFYGAGTPSVTRIGDWFYLYFQDDTFCNGSSCSSPTPQGYILRSKNPAFPLNAREELRQVSGVVGFYADDLSKAYPIWNSSGADLVFHEGLDSMMLVNTGDIANQNLAAIIYNRSFQPATSPVTSSYPLAKGLTFFDGYWTEAPGFLRSTLGHAVYNPYNYSQGSCEIPLKVMRSVGTPGQANSPTWDLSYVGITKSTSQNCGTIIRKPPYDFDGDRQSDPVVYRKNASDMYIRQSSTWDEIHDIGTTSSIAVHGDFDGDRIADVAVVVPNGTASGYIDWTWISSINGSVNHAYTWGLNSDDIAVGDYNGDGKDDFAIWRDSTATFWVLYSSYPNSPTVSTSFQFGVSGDIAVPEDYDGDGADDFAIVHPATGNWSIYNSSTGNTTNTVFIDQYCRPIPGDFDNDGLADLGCWRWKNTKFYVKRSTSGAIESLAWGLSGDVPVKGDFNGDGKLDYNVWRPSNGNWYTSVRGTGESMTQQWGGLVSDQVPKEIENQS